MMHGGDADDFGADQEPAEALDDDDPLAAARGICNGLLISAVLAAITMFMIWLL